MNALLLISFCVGNIVGPLSFTEDSAPDYNPAKVTIIATCGAAIVFVGALQAYYVVENKRRDRVKSDGDLTHESDTGFKDVTDRKNMEFRYRL
jgi:hypothetical protein